MVTRSGVAEVPKGREWRNPAAHVAVNEPETKHPVGVDAYFDLNIDLFFAYYIEKDNNRKANMHNNKKNLPLMASCLSFEALLDAARDGNVPLDHSGTTHDRLDRLPEAVYIDQWKHANAPGRNVLVKILGRWPTQEEADVAANVIQWLGTAVGLGFVRQSEAVIEQRKAAARH